MDQIIEDTSRGGESSCRLEKRLTEDGVDDLIARSVERLLEFDSPSLETIKMQVAFDSSYVAEEMELMNHYERRRTHLKGMQRTVAGIRLKGGADFDALTALHRQVGIGCNTRNPPRLKDENATCAVHTTVIRGG